MLLLLLRCKLIFRFGTYRSVTRAAGTFGQNSTGGGINVITKAPTFDDFYGTADLTVGEYSLVKARAAMNIPMSDTLAARVSLMSHKHDGYTDNVGNGQDLDDADGISAGAGTSFSAKR